MRIQTPLELGSVVRARRRELGLTQADLALVARTGIRFVSELERGKATARVGDVLKLLAALGLSLEARVR